MDGVMRSQGMDRWERFGLGLLFLFTLSALGGYWAFALHPEWLPQDPFALRFYSSSFRFFAQLQIIVAATALLIPLGRRMGRAWVPAFSAVFLVSFLSEYMGTGYGIPFGGYHYTALLGIKLGGRVPFLIPLSWFLMTVPSYVLARHALGNRPAWLVLSMASLLLVIWDLALDPAMSALTPYWVWEESGPYYGMPWMNLFGWFVTGLALMALVHRLGGDSFTKAMDVGLARWLYAGILLMPLGMVVAASEWLAVGATLLALAGWGALARALAAESDSPGHAVEGTVPTLATDPDVPEPVTLNA
jgi:uncharacterized membrane protein